MRPHERRRRKRPDEAASNGKRSQQESRALAALAQSETRAGNAVNGMLLALRGMPIADAEEPRPVVTETRQALVDATLADGSCWSCAAMRGRSRRPRSRPMARGSSSGSADDTVRVWDAASGAELLVLRGHEGSV